MTLTAASLNELPQSPPKGAVFIKPRTSRNSFRTPISSGLRLDENSDNEHEQEHEEHDLDDHTRVQKINFETPIKEADDEDDDRIMMK